MSRIEWNKAGERFFEVGSDRGVLYPRIGPGVAWNGLVGVSEDASGGELESLFFEGVKYVDLISGEDFAATIEAYTAPPEFGPSNGLKMLSPGLFVTNQRRVPFGLSYRTLIGNDLVGQAYGYKIHLAYNCLAAPSGVSHKTLSDSVAPATRSWSITTVPPKSSTFRPTAHLIVDSTLATPAALSALEDILYGNDILAPRMPTIAEVIAVLATP